MLLKYLFLLIKYMVHKILNFKRKFKDVPAWRNGWIVTDFINYFAYNILFYVKYYIIVIVC
jgi:hypothetical protein